MGQAADESASDQHYGLSWNRRKGPPQGNSRPAIEQSRQSNPPDDPGKLKEVTRRDIPSAEPDGKHAETNAEQDSKQSGNQVEYGAESEHGLLMVSNSS